MFSIPRNPPSLLPLGEFPGVPLVVADMETQKLRPPYRTNGRRAWENALYRRDPDGAEAWLEGFVDLRDLPWDPDDEALDREGLNIGRFFERHPQVNPAAPGQVYREADMAQMIFEFFHDIAPVRGKTQRRRPWFLGAVPSFDADGFLDMLYRHGYDTEDLWHHRLACMETYVAGLLRQPPPWSGREMSLRVGIDPADYAQHTARGDVEWARDLYDAVQKSSMARLVARARLRLRRLQGTPQGQVAA